MRDRIDAQNAGVMVANTSRSNCANRSASALPLTGRFSDTTEKRLSSAACFSPTLIEPSKNIERTLGNSFRPHRLPFLSLSPRLCHYWIVWLALEPTACGLAALASSLSASSNITGRASRFRAWRMPASVVPPWQYMSVSSPTTGFMM